MYVALKLELSVLCCWMCTLSVESHMVNTLYKAMRPNQHNPTLLSHSHPTHPTSKIAPQPPTPHNFVEGYGKPIARTPNTTALLFAHNTHVYQSVHFDSFRKDSYKSQQNCTINIPIIFHKIVGCRGLWGYFGMLSCWV